MNNTKTIHAVLGAAMAGALLLTACGTSPGPAGSSSRMTPLSGSAEVPPVSTPASGNAETSYNKDTKILRWTISYANLSAAATGGHFHGPAMPGSNAPVVVPFNGSLASPITGMAMLSEGQAADFLAGRWYVNLHTAANPGGEIRGQVSPGY